ncbi:MAG: hypothetical protein CMN76_08845 [Spirochaetaceae bacterium]|nr:hypothetical protein [Spirochaetaceae bacterium]
MACGKCGSSPPVIAAESGDCRKNTTAPIPEGFRDRRNERLAICLECPALKRYVKISKMEQCGLCACFVRAKTAVPWERCPAGFWK